MNYSGVTKADARSLDYGTDGALTLGGLSAI